MIRPEAVRPANVATMMSSKKIFSMAGVLLLIAFLSVFFSSSTEMHSVEAAGANAGVQIKNASSTIITTSTTGSTKNNNHPGEVPITSKEEENDDDDDDDDGATSSPTSLVQDSEESSGRRTYVPRGRLHVFGDNNATIAAQRQAVMEQWGSWNFVDPKGDDERRPPQDDFYAAFPYRDIPRAKFPANAWQIDVDFLSQFVPESIQLVERAQKAILAEYGQQDPTETSAMMFHIFRYNASDKETVTDQGAKQGGWTTHGSWQGLVRRILHAIMTEDVFVFAMGGHSAAAGHGNHFQQSYMLQVQWILESVFARMGVHFMARNFGNGGLGTIHNGMAAGDIYGHDVDMLLWDSGMTENSNRHQAIFHRQGLLASSSRPRPKVPVLWTKSTQIAREYHQAAGVDIGIPGSGTNGIYTCNTYEELMAQPFAARYLKCGGEVKSICKNHRYDGVCWIDRPDVIPTQPQSKEPGGRASWHPGNREHQLFGRVLAYTILEATKDALHLWKEQAPNWILEDEVWHVKSHYETQRQRIDEMNLEEYHCANYESLNFTCRYPMKARTEFTPRAFPSLTNIRTLMPPEMLANINEAPRNIYEAPDVFNPSLHPPEGEIDVLSIVEAGVPFQSILAPTWAKDVYKRPTFSKPPHVPVGKGIGLDTRAGDEFCDGSLDSFCSRGSGENCLLKAHNDGRNGLKFDAYSGWMVMNIPDLLHGYIVIKLETWHQPGSVSKTEGWTSINNETMPVQRNLHEQQRGIDDCSTLSLSNQSAAFQSSSSSFGGIRRLKKKPPELAKDFEFQYAINGNITSMDKATFLQKKQDVARVVEMVVLLNDPTFTGGVESEVEVAVRIIGSGRQNTFKMSHIYWA